MDRRNIDRRPEALDEAGHAALTAAILARTSGSSCLSARDRLGDYVDGVLPAFDHGLVGAHLDHCEACSALAGALARSVAVLPTFAEIAPPPSLAAAVLAATSRRVVEPGIGERVAAWLARAAIRPRFAVSVAYVATILIVLFVGDPIAAARRAWDKGAIYAQPVVAAVGERVAAGIENARTLGAEAMSAAASVGQRQAAGSSGWDAGVSAVRQWLTSNLGAPLASVIERVAQWIQAAMDAVIRLMRPEPAKQLPPTEPSSELMRS